MSKGIPLSPKHGVNPSLETCFWCGGHKGVALLGRMKGDAEAPKEICLGIEPCDECKEKFKLGVQIVEVIDDGSRFENNLRFAIKAEDGKVKWPTGRFVVMRAESIKGGKAGQVMLCEPGVMDKIFENHDKKAEGADKPEEESQEKATHIPKQTCNDGRPELI